MTTPIDLRPFCSTDESRPALADPSQHGDYIYATDGRLGIRIPNDGRTLPERDTGHIAAQLAGFINAAIKDESRAVPMPALPVLEFDECKGCKGTGIIQISKCKECDGEGSVECDLGHDHDCRACHKTGWTADPKAPSTPCDECEGDKRFAKQQFVKIKYCTYNAHLLAKFAGLPNVRIIENGFEAAGILFDGGAGCVMPLQT